VINIDRSLPMPNSREPSLAVGVEGEGRQRHLVGDKPVVGQDRGREKAVAGKSVSKSAARRHNRQRSRERKPRSSMGV
jgi:hypothetical protein